MIRGANLKPPPGGRVQDVTQPADLARLAGWGFDAARLMLARETVAALMGQMPASTLGALAGQAAQRCYAVGFKTVIVCLVPAEDGGPWSADAICADPAKLAAYVELVHGVAWKLRGDGCPAWLEPMNEPQCWGDDRSGTPADETRCSWAPINTQIYAAVRAADPLRFVLQSGPMGSWLSGLPYFTPSPAMLADPLWALSLHWYGFKDGLFDDGRGGVGFTHQGAPWCGGMAEMAGVRWPAQPDRMTLDLARASVWCAAHGIPPARVMLTEYGCLRFADGVRGCALPDVAQHLRDVTAATDALGFGGRFVFDGAAGTLRPGTDDNAFSLLLADGSTNPQPEIIAALST